MKKELERWITPRATRLKFYNILEVCDQILKKYRVVYSLWAGSLLGCIRHGAMIPWDDDIDLMIFEDAEKKILSTEFISELNEHSMNLLNEEDGTVYHIYKEVDDQKLSPLPIAITQMQFWYGQTEYNEGKPFVDFPLVDLFVYKKDQEKGNYHLKKFIWEREDALSENEVYPIKKGWFGKNLYNVINKPNIFLQRAFGNEYLSQAHITHFHNTHKRELLSDSKINFFLENEKRLEEISYWDSFYQKKQKNMNQPSLFAKYIAKKLITGNENVLDLGCRDGRDSHLFFQLGCHVLGVDASTKSEIVDEGGFASKGTLQFIRLDINKLQPEIFENKNIVFARFLLHVLKEEEENALLDHLSQFLDPNSRLCIEARTINDEYYGQGVPVKGQPHSWIYEGHFRRFIDPQKLKSSLERYKFKIEEMPISKGFAPFPKKNENPECVRFIVRKDPSF